MSMSSEDELEIVGEYVPEKIVAAGIRKRADGSEYNVYKVRWVGYKAKDDTWEPEEHLKDRKDIVDQYLCKIGLKKKVQTTKTKAPKQVKSKLLPLEMVNSEEEKEEEEEEKENVPNSKASSDDEEPSSGNEADNVEEPSSNDNSGSESDDEDDKVKQFVASHLKGKSWHKRLKEVKEVRHRNGNEEVCIVFENGDEGWCPTEPIQEKAPNLMIAYLRGEMRKK